MKHKSLILIIAALVLFLTQCAAPTESTDKEISQWRGPDRTGFYPETGLLSEWPENGPEVIWETDTLGAGYSTVAVTSDKVYTAGAIDSTSYLFAFDHEGNLLWKKEYGLTWTANFPGTRSTPLIYDGVGYILSARGKLVSFNAETGDFIWTKDIFEEFDAKEIHFGLTENLLIDGNKLFCTPGDSINSIVALDRKTGDLIWSSPAVNEQSAYCSPTIITHNGVRYLVTITAKSIVGLNPKTGELSWSHDLNYRGTIHGNTPVYDNGYIFAMNPWNGGSVMMKIAEDGSSVEEVWRSELFDLEHGDVLKIGDNIYGSSWQHKVFSVVDWKTGVVKDSTRAITPASIVSAEGLIYAYTYNGDVHLVKPLETGIEIISSFKAPGKHRDHIAHPVIKDGRLYIRFRNQLVVYNIKA